MILRRVIEHFRKQEWTAIFLDFLIVVAGILIAFQITAWNERREDRETEAQYLAQLVDDLNADLASIDRVNNAAGRRMSVIALVLERAELAPPPATFHFQNCAFEPCSGVLTFEAEAPYSSDDPSAANDMLNDLRQYNPVRHSYDALISTGDIGLLRDSVVRRNIQAYYANASAVESFEQKVMTVFYDLGETRHEFGIAIGGSSLDDLVAAAKASPKFAAQLRSHWVHSGFQIRSMNHAREIAKDLIADLEAAK